MTPESLSGQQSPAQDMMMIYADGASILSVTAVQFRRQLLLSQEFLVWARGMRVLRKSVLIGVISGKRRFDVGRFPGKEVCSDGKLSTYNREVCNGLIPVAK